jgi:hypothetical protein
VTILHQEESVLAKVVGVEDTSRESPVPTEPPPVVVLRSVDQQREEKRGEIALLLVRLLAGLGVSALALLASSGWLRLDIASIKEILTVVFPSVVALVGTVIGFYFGGRVETSASRRGPTGHGRPNP